MPTEESGFKPEKILFKDQDGIIKELASYETKKEENDDDM